MNPRRFHQVLEERETYRKVNRFLWCVVALLALSLMFTVWVLAPVVMGWATLIFMGVLMIGYVLGGVLWVMNRRDLE